MTLPQLSIWTDDTDTVVAFSAEDACLVCADHMGESMPEYLEHYGEPEDWHELPLGHELTIWEECYAGTPVKKSASDWLRSEGREFLASTEC